MNRALIIMLAAACADEATPAYRLDQERIVAVRATPPHIQPDETARLDALLAHADAPTSEEQPVGASAAFAPADLYTAVHYNIDHWEVNGPDENQLAAARAELGLPDGAAVPLEVTLEFPGPRYATKTVWLGSTHPNPPAPALPITDLPVGRDVELVIEVSAASRVRWLTSCGELVDDDKHTTTFHADRSCSGELAVVVRDRDGGVAWRVVSITAQ